jgi:hypothetical protein
VQPFKGIFYDDISEFESSHPSHAVGPKQMSIDQFGEFFREDFAEMLQLAKEAHIEPTD